MGFSYRILGGAPQTGWVIFTADRRSIALAAVFAAVDKKTTAADAIGEISDRPFRFGAGIPGQRFAGVRLRNQGAVQPAWCNIKKICLDAGRRSLAGRLAPVLREHVIEGRLQALAAERGADKIFVGGCRACAEFELVIDYPHSVIFAVDAVQPPADQEMI